VGPEVPDLVVSEVVRLYPQLSHIQFHHFSPAALANVCETLTGLKSLALTPWRRGHGVCVLPDSISSLRNLDSLEAQGLAGPLPMGLGTLCSLSNLALEGYQPASDQPAVTTIPAGLSELRGLQKLRLRFKDAQDTELPFIGGFTALQQLHLHLPRLTTLELANVANLQHLHLETASLQSLPDFGHSLNKLSEVYLETESLQSLQPLSSLSSTLRRLTVKNFQPDLFDLPGSLTQLQRLTIRVSGSRSLPETWGNFTALQELHVHGCFHVEALPASFSNLAALRRLEIWSCDLLAALPESFGDLQALQELDIRRGSFAALPESLGNLPALRSLFVWDCSLLAAIPEGLGNLTALQILSINECLNLATLPESLGNLAALQTFLISDCSRLVALPDSLGNLSALDGLIIKRCKHLDGPP